jgi:hypothetical protein
MLNDMPQKNDDRLSVRVPSELRAVLAEIEEKHGYGEPLLARKCLEAVAAFYKKHGYFSFPVHVVPDAEFVRNVADSAQTTKQKKSA